MLGNKNWNLTCNRIKKIYNMKEMIKHLKKAIYKVFKLNITTHKIHKVFVLYDEKKTLKDDIKHLKQQVRQMKKDIGERKRDITELKRDIEEMKKDMRELK